MKIRSSHIVALVLAAIGAVVVLALVRGAAGRPRVTTADTDRFLEGVREQRARGLGSTETAGLYRGTDTDQSLVPVIELPIAELDFGTIPNKGETVKRVPIYNRGRAPLEILDVSTTCGCTQGTVKGLEGGGLLAGKKAIIPPAGQSDLIVTVYPDKIPGFYSRKSLAIISNDPNNTTLEIDVVAQVDPEYLLDPPTLNFGTVDKGTAAELTMIIRQAGDEPVVITDVIPGRQAAEVARRLGTDEPVYTLHWEPRPASEWQTPGRAEWKVTARLSPLIPPGDFRDYFTIFSNVKRIERGEFELFARIAAFYDVLPPNIAVRKSVAPGARGVGSAIVKGRGPIELSDVRVSSPDIEVSVQPGPEENSAELVLSVSPNARLGLRSEQITFQVTSGDRSVTHTMRAMLSIRPADPA